MNTIGPAPDASAASSTQDSRTSTEDPDARYATVRTPARLLDRISEAVRAAHAASVPF